MWRVFWPEPKWANTPNSFSSSDSNSRNSRQKNRQSQVRTDKNIADGIFYLRYHILSCIWVSRVVRESTLLVDSGNFMVGKPCIRCLCEIVFFFLSYSSICSFCIQSLPRLLWDSPSHLLHTHTHSVFHILDNENNNIVQWSLEFGCGISIDVLFSVLDSSLCENNNL